ncbi:hypothetical protein ACOCJ5_17515 [Knoellia sp. CPCC 206450]|uniref:hypothetical protein n=1 Tax=Knoellia tibetensis TaxID=3404798 RepID=UPI003B430D2C
MSGDGVTGERLEVAVRASAAWYADVFEVHGIPNGSEDGLWSAAAEPPRWHSAAKTLRPGVPAERVVAAVQRFRECSVADSYGDLDLGSHGFRRLFSASWVHRDPREGGATWPESWSVVGDAADLARWNALHDTQDVLLPALLTHPRFTFLVRHDGDEMVAGAVLRDVGEAVELSNTWATSDGADEVTSLVACAAVLHPGLPIVGYDRGEALARLVDAGFAEVGPQVVWVREP